MTETNDEDDVRRGRGRPRKWVDNAERMRAYRADKRAELAELEALSRADGRAGLLERIDQITTERDALHIENNSLRAENRDLRARVDELEQHARTSPPAAGLATDPDLPTRIGLAAIAAQRDATSLGPATADEATDAADNATQPALNRQQRRRLERDQAKRRGR